MTISVRWLGHSTVVLDVDGVRLMTDPLLRRHAGLLRRATAPPTPDSYADTRAVLLSHLHLDHADLGSLRLVGAAPILASGPISAWLTAQGLMGQMVDDAWQAVAPGVDVRLVPAVHHSRPMPHRPNDAHGFLLRCSWGTVWFAGDTGLYPDMTRLPELADAPIDLALLPIHGWGPRLSPGHLDPLGAAEVCRLVHAAYVVPIHYGTLHPAGFQLAPRGWMRTPAERFAAALPWLSPGTTLIPLTPMGPAWTG